MSHNHNFNNNFTFRFVPDFPPPPLPPPLLPPIRPPFFPPQHYIPQSSFSQENADQEFLKQFETKIQGVANKFKPKAASIVQLRGEMQGLVASLRDIETQVKDLKDNIGSLSEEEWKSKISDAEALKSKVTENIKKCAGKYLDMSRRVLAKRTAKRLRLKRQKEERKLAKKERTKLLEERSRKIDENLQKIKDDILKAQQEEQAKLEADVVLREVVWKKQDAKKCVAKLDALIKLRKARQNTAKGRGEAVSDREAGAFLYDIEKLKTLWKERLLTYDSEESELKAKLAADTVEASSGVQDTEKEAVANLARWRELLFGAPDASPQVVFQGDLREFVAVRSQWDQYLNSDGSSIPVGWVVPSLEP